MSKSRRSRVFNHAGARDHRFWSVGGLSRGGFFSENASMNIVLEVRSWISPVKDNVFNSLSLDLVFLPRCWNFLQRTTEQDGKA